MRNVDFNDLQVFATVATAGSLRRAASRLNLSQPSVSQRLTRLETSLGVELVERSTRGTELTEAGRRLLPYLERGMELMHEALAAVHAGAGSPTLSVWTDEVLAPVVVPFIHRALADRRIALSHRVAEVDKILRALASGDADVGFSPEPPPADSIESEPFFQDRLGFVVHPDHPLATAERVTVADLVAHEIAVVDWGTGIDVAVNHLMTAGVPLERLRIVRPTATATMLSRYCGHVGVCIRTSLRAPVEAGWLVELDVVDVAPWRVDVHLVYRSADAEEDVIAGLRQAVRAAWDRDDICSTDPDASDAHTTVEPGWR